ncbi:MAG: PIN domain-containing protein [Ignavibacteria bacterium]|nr:PIN domain-containing protein [Ignavibacteria bacterium]
MKGKYFLDTNILIYLYSTEEKKQKRVLELLQNEDEFVISTQVLSEFCNVLKKKFKFTTKQLNLLFQDFEKNFLIHPTDIEQIKTALTISDRYKYSFYDALVIAGAIHSGCTLLFSEDLQHGQTVLNKVKIINPFRV